MSKLCALKISTKLVSKKRSFLENCAPQKIWSIYSISQTCLHTILLLCTNYVELSPGFSLSYSSFKKCMLWSAPPHDVLHEVYIWTYVHMYLQQAGKICTMCWLTILAISGFFYCFCWLILGYYCSPRGSQNQDCTKAELPLVKTWLFVQCTIICMIEYKCELTGPAYILYSTLKSKEEYLQIFKLTNIFLLL